MLKDSHLIVKSRHIIFLFSLFLFLGSCQNVKKMEKPKDLIPEDKMIDVLAELSLVQAARNYNKFKLESLGVEPGEYIYNKFGIDSLQLERSTEYYAENYIQYDRMYDSVKAKIRRLKAKTDSLREIEVKIEDSINKAKKDSLRALDSLGVDTLKVDSLKERKTNRLRDSLVIPPSATTENSIG